MQHYAFTNNYMWKFLKQFLDLVRQRVTPHVSYFVCVYPLHPGILHLLRAQSSDQWPTLSVLVSLGGTCWTGPLLFLACIAISTLLLVLGLPRLLQSSDALFILASNSASSSLYWHIQNWWTWFSTFQVFINKPGIYYCHIQQMVKYTSVPLMASHWYTIPYQWSYLGDPPRSYGHTLLLHMGM